jgi:hypothetical protein
MQKKTLLFSLLLFPALCFGNSTQENEFSDDTDDHNSNEVVNGPEESEIAARDKKQSRSSRKLSKDPRGRDAYLKGNEEYQNYQDQNRVNSGRNVEK